MNNNRITVSGELNVEFPRDSARFPGQSCGIECVLWCTERITAVSDDRRPVAG
jgi:hypothetical protein